MEPEQFGIMDGTPEGQPPAPEPQTQATPTPEAAPQPEFKAEEWEHLKYKGQPMNATSRDQITTWAQKGYAHDQSMEELRARENDLNQRTKDLQKYVDLEKRFTDNPEFANRVWTLNEQHQQGVVGQSEGENPEISRMQNDFRDYKEQTNAELESYRNDRADRQVGDELDKIMANNPNIDWNRDEGFGTMKDKVIKHAIEAGNVPLQMAFRDMTWDSHTKNAQFDALKNSKEQQQANQTKGIVSGGQPAPPAPQNNGIAPTYNAAESNALEQLKGLTRS